MVDMLRDQRVGMVPPDVPVGAPQAPVKQPEPSFFERVNSFFKDEEKVAKFIMALEPMKPSFRQGSAPVQWAQSTLANSQKQRQVAQQGNATAQLLRKMGRDDLANAVESNPSLALDAVREAYKMGAASPKAFAPTVDPETGEIFVPEYDPRTGEVRTIPTGRMGQTPAQKAELELSSAERLNDTRAAQERGFAAIDRVGQIDSQILNLETVIQKLDEGAGTGILRSQLPAFDAATAELRSTANLLGIDVINMATFGALSEKELSLAMSTGLPQNLSEEELKTWARNKIEAQQKLRQELWKKAKILTSGIGLSEFNEKYNVAEPKTGEPSAPAPVATKRYNPETGKIESI